MRVLEDDDPARPEIRVLHGFYVLGRYEARLGGHPSHDEPGVDRRAAPLVHEDVRPLFGEQHAARPRLRAQRRLVRHRRRGQEEGGLVAEQRRHAALELVRRGVLEVLLVADLGSRHRRSHSRGRLR